MVSFFLFFIDFLLYNHLHQWLVHTLLIHFALVHCILNPPKFTSLRFYEACFLFLLQDFFLYGRFGLGLVMLVPLILIAYKFQRLLIRPTLFLPLFLTVIILIEGLLIKKFIFHQNISFFMTITKIFITISIGYVGLIGLRSNRSFLLNK